MGQSRRPCILHRPMGSSVKNETLSRVKKIGPLGKKNQLWKTFQEETKERRGGDRVLLKNDARTIC